MKRLFRSNINLNVLISVRKESRGTGRKTLVAQERSTTRTLSHETHTPDMVSVVTGTTR